MSYQQVQGKDTAWRVALMRNLVTELIVHEKLTITETRAKELRRHVEKLITLAKRNDLHARRQALKVLRNVKVSETEDVLQKLFNKIGPRYKDRDGGYTRIIKLNNRRGDNALKVVISLV